MPKDTTNEFKPLPRARVRGITGAGGGGKSGGGPPVEAANTLQTNAILRLIDVLGEGPIKGVRQIYLNETPLTDENDQPNFKGVGVETRLGLPSQPPVTGFSSQAADVIVDALVEKATPVLQTITDPDTDAARVTIKIPALFHYKDSGDMVGTGVSYSIQYRPSGGGWIDIPGSPFTLTDEKNTAPIFLPYRFNLTGAAPWDIRVTRITDDTVDNTKLQNSIFYYSTSQIIEQKFTYPNTAYLAMTLNAQQFGESMPTRAALVDGLICRVPTNFNPLTRTYTGIWNGTFKEEWTDCPAWCVYEMITNPRFGLGEFINSAYIDPVTLYSISQYCAQQVDNGQGGTEPRFTFNAYIGTRQEAYDLINAMCSVFRGMVYWSFGAALFTQDAPANPILTVSRANTVNGDFAYQGASILTVHNRVNVTYNNPANFYKRDVVTVDDPEHIAKYGLRPTDIIAFGCTSKAQAIRAGRWLMYTERMESDILTYVAGPDHVDAVPGSIVRVMDPSVMGVSMAGRLAAYNGSTVTLDRSVELLPGVTYEFVVHDSDRVLHYRTVMSAPGATSTLLLDVAVPTLTKNPRETVWALRRVGGTDTLYRILSSKEVGDHQYEVTAIRHNPDKYSIIENGYEIPAYPVALLPTGPLPVPFNLQAREQVIPTSGTQDQVSIVVSVTRPSDPRVRGVELQYRRLGQEWRTVDMRANTQHTIDAAVAGDRYQFQTRSYDAIGNTSRYSDTVNITVTDTPVTVPVPDPTNRTVAGIVRGIAVTWTNPAVAAFKEVNVFVNTVNNSATATHMVATPGEFYILDNLSPGAVRHVWLQTVLHGSPLRLGSKVYVGTATSLAVQQADLSASLQVDMAAAVSAAGYAADAAADAALDADAANTARTLAEAAATSANSAVTQAELASTASERAAAETFPSGFSEQGRYWTSNSVVDPDVAPDPVGWLFTDDPSMGAIAYLLPSAANRTLRPKAVIPLVANRRYRVTIVAKHVGAFAGGSATALRCIWRRITATWTNGGDIVNNLFTFTAPDVEQTFTRDVTLSGSDPFVAPLLFVPTSNFGTAGPELRVKTFLIEDVTSQLAAADSAAAASVSSGQAAASEVNADNARALALSYADLSADLSGRALGEVVNAFLQPADWTDWTTAPTRTANEVYPQGETLSWSLTAGQQGGAYTETSEAGWVGVENPSAFAVDVEFTLVSGTINGAGVLVDWITTTPTIYRDSRSLASMLPGGVATIGVLTVATAIFEKPDTFTGTFASNRVYVMAGFASLGTLDSKNLKIHRVSIRPVMADAQAAISAADIALTHATDAGVSAAEALSYRNASARLTSGGVSKNPIFSDWGSTNPENVVVFTGGTSSIDKLTTGVRYINAIRLNGTDTAFSRPLVRLSRDTASLDCSPSPESVLVRLEVEYVSGTFGAGTLLQGVWTAGSGGTSGNSNYPLDGKLQEVTGIVQTLEVVLPRPNTYVAGAAETFHLQFLARSGATGVCSVIVHRFDFEEVLADSLTSIYQRAVAQTDDITSAVVGLRAVAGSGGALLELVALDDPINGAVSLARIAADNIVLDGSVTMRHLTISAANMIANPYFLNGSLRDWRLWTNPGLISVVARGDAGVPANAPSPHVLRMQFTTTSQQTSIFNGSPAYSDAGAEAGAIPVKAGESYRMSVWAVQSLASGLTSFAVRLFWRLADGTYTTQTVGISLGELTTAWAEYTSIPMTAPADAVSCHPYVLAQNDSGVALAVHWTGLTLRPMTGSDLVVDGSIKGQHIDTATLTVTETMIANDAVSRQAKLWDIDNYRIPANTTFVLPNTVNTFDPAAYVNDPGPYFASLNHVVVSGEISIVSESPLVSYITLRLVTRAVGGSTWTNTGVEELITVRPGAHTIPLRMYDRFSAVSASPMEYALRVVTQVTTPQILVYDATVEMRQVNK